MTARPEPNRGGWVNTYDTAQEAEEAGASEPSGTNLMFTYADDITTDPITFSDPATSGTDFGSWDDGLQTFTFSKDCTVVLSLEMQLTLSATAAGYVRFALGGTLSSNNPYLAQSNDEYRIPAVPVSGGSHVGPIWTTPPLVASAGDTLEVSFPTGNLNAGSATNGATALGLVQVK